MVDLVLRHLDQFAVRGAQPTGVQRSVRGHRLEGVGEVALKVSDGALVQEFSRCCPLHCQRRPVGSFVDERVDRQHFGERTSMGLDDPEGVTAECAPAVPRQAGRLAEIVQHHLRCRALGKGRPCIVEVAKYAVTGAVVPADTPACLHLVDHFGEDHSAAECLGEAGIATEERHGRGDRIFGGEPTDGAGAEFVSAVPFHCDGTVRGVRAA